MMLENKETDFFREYLHSVNDLLPYPENIKSDALNELIQDMKEAWEDLRAQYPDEEERFQVLTDQFGSPEEAAINLCEANEWHHRRVGFKLRIAAYFIDAFLSGLLSLVTIAPIYIFHLTEDASNILVYIVRILIVLTLATLSPLVVIGYFVISEGLFAATLGKKIFGLKVVSEKGIKITWQQAIIRNFTKIRGELLLLDFLIGKYLMKLDQQRAMDKLAETIVIKC